jgi:CBS domain-containing protein
MNSRAKFEAGQFGSALIFSLFPAQSAKLNSCPMLPTVADVMTADPIAVQPETALQDAIQILAERHISGLPVVDSSGKLVGVLSEADLIWREAGVTPPPYIMILDSVIYLENPAKYERELHKALGQTVGEVMTSTNLVTITPDASLRKAAQLIQEHKAQRLLVVNSAHSLDGILTRGDIVRFMASHPDA